MTSTVPRPSALTTAVYLLCAECFLFAVLIAVFVYRTLNEVSGYSVYFGSTEEKRAAALAEALVIGGLLVIAVILMAACIPALLRGQQWARISMIAVAAGLVVYPMFLMVRSLGDPLYVDWMKVSFTFSGAVGGAVAIILLCTPSTSRYVRALNSR